MGTRLLISVAPLYLRFDQFFAENNLYCEDQEIKSAVISNVINSVLSPKENWENDSTGSMMIDYLVRAINIYHDLAVLLWRYLMEEAMVLLCAYVPNIMDPGYVPTKHVFKNNTVVEIEFS